MEVINIVIIFVTLSCLCLFQLGCSQGVKGYSAPAICQTRQCVPYQIIHSQKEFEIRKYNVTYWIETSTIVSKSYTDAYQKGFNVLLGYIQGNNIPKIKLNMTAPILIDFESDIEIGSVRYEVNYKIPEKVEYPAPYPSQKLTKVGHPMLLFGAVRRLYNYLNNTIIASELKELEKHLESTPWKVKEKYPIVSVADYEPPLSRINEIIIWFNYPSEPSQPF